MSDLSSSKTYSSFTINQCCSSHLLYLPLFKSLVVEHCHGNTNEWQIKFLRKGFPFLVSRLQNKCPHGNISYSPGDNCKVGHRHVAKTKSNTDAELHSLLLKQTDSSINTPTELLWTDPIREAGFIPSDPRSCRLDRAGLT